MHTFYTYQVNAQPQVCLRNLAPLRKCILVLANVGQQQMVLDIDSKSFSVAMHVMLY